MLAWSAATATGEVNHVDFGHEVTAWLIGHDLGMQLSLAKDEVEADSEDVAQEDKVVKVKEQDVKHEEMFAAKSAFLVATEKGDAIETRKMEAWYDTSHLGEVRAYARMGSGLRKDVRPPRQFGIGHHSGF